MKRSAVILVLSIALWARAEEGTNSLSAHQKTYEQDLAKVEAESRKALDAWPDQYAQALKNLEQKLQKAGDLESLMLVKAEAERFSKARKVSADALVPAVPELAVLQSKAIQTSSSIELGRCKKVVALVEKYIAGLEELKKSQTKQGRFDDALTTKQEIEQARKRPEVTAAQFALADTGDKAEPAAPAEPEETPKTAATGTRSLPPAFLKGLVLYYSFDKYEGSKVTDASGKGNDGAVKGATWTPDGRAGGSYRFDGKHDYIGLPSGGVIPGGSFAILAWIRPVEIGSLMVCYVQGTGNYISLRVDARGGFAGCADGNNLDQSSTTLNAGNWDHVGMVYDGEHNTIYINGVAETRNARTANYTRDVASIGAGNQGGRAEYNFNGSIDEVRIYNRALSAQEVKQLFASYGVAPKSSTAFGKGSPAKSR